MPNDNNIIPESVVAEQLGVKVPYSRYTIPKGRAKDKITMRLSVEQLSDEQKMTLIGGAKGLNDLVNKTLIQRGYDYFNDATDDKGEFSLDDFKTLASGVPLPTENLEDLRDQKTELLEEAMTLMQASLTAPLSTDQQARAKEIGGLLRDIQESIKTKEAIGAKRAAARKANEKAKETGAVTVVQAAA